MEHTCFYNNLVATLTTVLAEELATTVKKIDEIKNERSRNTADNYFNFLNGKLEGLNNSLTTLERIGRIVTDSFEDYMAEMDYMEDDGLGE